MCMQMKQFRDVEAGIYLEMMDIPDDNTHREFICKVYMVIAIQLLLTALGIAAVVILIQPLAYFLAYSSVGLPFYLVICIAAIVSLCLLYSYDLANYLLLGVLTATLALLVGLTCAVATGKAILGSMILTIAMVILLTRYTFWAASRGHNFDFLRPFLCGAIVLIVVFASVQIIYPLGRIFVMFYGCFGTIAFSAYIICFTDGLIINAASYDKYIWAAVSLYVDFINLFLLLLSIFKALDY
ncbi:protein LIFEGUARD 4-like [Mercurialis annua]|uniref:protein LIFEGUARD 4-like n=1 Tax=Mercurialis annua TaxID=3986 RepID=UPI00215E8A57|nr:protein LIFEGUARD 4-like [Mercurialis annua]